MEPSEENIWAIELMNNFSNTNISAIQDQLHDLLDLLIYLHEILAEKNIAVDENEVLSEELIMKFYLHGLSICKIGKTYEFQSKYFKNPNLSSLKLIDLSSLLTVGRAQLEALLMYQHLYINTDDKDEQKLRYYAWIYTALLQRQKIHANNEESKKQKEKDLNEIKRIKSNIIKLKSFEKLSTNQKNSLIESGSGKLFKHWSKIFEESGFSVNNMFSKWYYILSAYSHSEGLSVIQMKNSKYFINNIHNSEVTLMQTFLSLMMTSLMIKNINNKYEMVANRYNEIDKKTKYIIDYLCKISTIDDMHNT